MYNDEKTRFSVLGSGYFVKIFDKDHPLYQKIKLAKGLDLQSCLMDHQVFQRLGLKDSGERPYTSFYDVRPSKIYSVYCTDAFTRLEIRREKQKTLKIFFKDLIRTDYIFPPEYIMNRTTLINEGLMVLEFDKGYFGTTIHPSLFLNSDNLTFELLTIPELNTVCVRSIVEDRQQVILKRPDTVTCGMYAFLT